MDKINEKTILDSLRHIIDPDLDKDIVSLGFVKNIAIDGENISFDIELTTPACPIKDEFQSKAKGAVLKLAGVKNVKINMTSVKKKSSFDTLQENSTLKDVKTIIAISSCKGGVGKSTIAAHIALEVANRGFKVGLLDTDIFGPSIPTLFDIGNDEKVYANEDKQIIPIEKYSLKIMSFGLVLGDGPAVLRGPLVNQYLMQILHNTAWGELDYLFIDMPPGTGDIQLTLTQSVQLDGAVVITTRQSLSLVDVSRGILMFENVKVPMLGIVENMSYFACEQCGTKNNIFGESKTRSLGERFGLDALAEIPIQKEFNAKISEYKKNQYFSQAADKVIMAVGKLSLLEDKLPQVNFDKNSVNLKWSDGRKTAIDNRTLRLACECARCVDELSGEKTLKESEVNSDMAATEVTPLGNYAIGIKWNDGHLSSIYSYDKLKKLVNV
tara:strand:+ start:1423 stop:2742 length:1320 start_codon:yes stop_codon:yes gene_type:complete